MFFVVTLSSLNTGKELVPEFFTDNFKSEIAMYNHRLLNNHLH